MIQLNLLPHVKLEYIKSERLRRLVFTVAVLVGVLAIALLVLLLGFDGLQKKHLSDLSRSIVSESSSLQAKPQISKILTVQNQLESLSALHASKPAASRFFNFLNQVTPAPVSITSFTTDFTQLTASITGTANALSSVNQYIDNLKATTYTTSTSSNSLKAFNNIVLTSFGVNSGAKDSSQAASYSITLGYDKNIFDINQTINLNVPSFTTTRSGVGQPTDLFQAPTVAPGSSAGGGHN